nr:ATP-binding protein [Halorhodospira halophila]
MRRVAEACRAWERLAQQIGLGEEAAGAVELALCEAINNAIIHACGNCPSRVVRVTVHQRADWLVLQVHDQGWPMTTEPASVDVRSGADCAEGGRGIGIIRGLMWHVRYRSGPAGNTLEMQYPLPGDQR